MNVNAALDQAQSAWLLEGWNPVWEAEPEKQNQS